jgi:D-alanine-D-alanine ligase-like ATP-grasp enzyme
MPESPLNDAPCGSRACGGLPAEMRICVLYADDEAADSPFAGLDPPADPTRWLSGHRIERHLVRKASAAEQIRALAPRGFDVFFNLCDGAAEEARAGLDVVRALEALALPFTGAGSSFYEPGREAMAMACRAAGLNAPAAVLARGPEGVARAAERLRFPLIVKHPESYGSIGLTPSSRVETTAALADEARRMMAAYGGAQIEEFIEGREFTVLVAEPPDGAALPLALSPVEFGFPPGESFKHFKLKWIEYAAATWTAVADPVLAGRLKDASRRLFVELGGSGYGRCDLRLDARGDIFVLEINPNCGICYAPEAPGSADVILAHDPLGHRGFLEHLLRCALRRAGLPRQGAD